MVLAIPNSWESDNWKDHEPIRVPSAGKSGDLAQPQAEGQVASPFVDEDDFVPAASDPPVEAADDDEDDDEDAEESPLADDEVEPVTAFELPFLESVE
jgi:hypothetical protein